MSPPCRPPLRLPARLVALALALVIWLGPPAAAAPLPQGPAAGASDRAADVGAALRETAEAAAQPLRVGARRAGGMDSSVAPVTSAEGSVSSARWLWPLDPPHPVLRSFEPPEHAYGPGHRGIDIAASAGAEVRAVEGGTVRFTGMVAGRPVVSILHHDGLASTYEPVEASVRVGEQVAAGDVIGVLAAAEHGGPHCEAGPCLHLGARRGGEDYTDPEVLLGARGPSVLLPWTDR